MWQNFQPAYRDPGWKNRDLGNQASQPSHMNTSKILQRIQRQGEISETGQPGSYEEALNPPMEGLATCSTRAHSLVETVSVNTERPDRRTKVAAEEIHEQIYRQ